jgi:hypothetical protein
VVLACTFVGSERPPSDREAQINQIEFDPAVPSFALRAAQTMKTTDELEFSFQNRSSALGEDRVAVVNDGAAISFAAIRYGLPTGLAIDMQSGNALWTWADSHGGRSYRFMCRG